MRNVMKC